MKLTGDSLSLFENYYFIVMSVELWHGIIWIFYFERKGQDLQNSILYTSRKNSRVSWSPTNYL